MYTFILRFKYTLEWFEYVATGRCRWCAQRNGRELLLAFRCDENVRFVPVGDMYEEARCQASLPLISLVLGRVQVGSTVSKDST